MRLATAVIAALALVLAGCGSSSSTITRGGNVIGTTLNVYSMLPAPGEGSSRDLVDAEKLALMDAGGMAGDYKVNFISLDETGGAGPFAAALRDAVADPQVIAVIGPAGTPAARAAVPVLNAAGILQVTPGAGYPGFTARTGPGEPERWQPSGRRTLARLVGDDRAQAKALLDAAGTKRVAVEQEPGAAADALVAALRAAGAHFVEDPARARAVIYAGEDADNAVGVLDGLAREAPKARLVVPDALTRAEIAGRLSRAARRRAVLVSSAPEPASTPELRRFEARFEQQFARPPGPYAAIGYEAMRSVLAAIEAAGDDARRRQAVIDAYFAAGEQRGTLLGDYRITPAGERVPAPFTTTTRRPGDSSGGSRVISPTPARARETTQLSFAASAAFWKAAASTPGTRPRVVSAILVIVGPASSVLRRLTFAWVSSDSGSLPASPSTSDSAIVKQPACAAAISSSGVVPVTPSPKRESKEYGPSKAPESSFSSPPPSRVEPCHCAVADRAAMSAS